MDLSYPGGKVRLYVEAALGDGVRVAPDDGQTHYLLHVMRARVGDRVGLFNGRDGEWLAQIVEAGKRGCTLQCQHFTARQTDVPDLWLVFAPIKKTPADYLAQKATELGVRALQPIITRRTIVSRVNVERLRANAVEAAEQSGRLSIPEVREPQSLDKLLDAWPKTRRILFCDEAGEAPSIAEALRCAPDGAWAVLTGPEGGFDPAERAALRAQPFVMPVSLGGRILRADTAALSALSVWQAVKGDWA
ncbi:MAG: 16S rRNA (uracil(1498)-N(3))-methyltransferase [Alphaproteobacteria bacterium]|nr:16S rRNA (uracil(1498)-N(3))-methyltransferase [Alphaproteobacteria bacterium]